MAQKGRGGPTGATQRVPALDIRRAAAGRKTRVTSASPAATPGPVLRVLFPTAGGGGIVLCAFASAGAAGNRYVSWLLAAGLKPAALRRENPLRAAWP
jgi:hypothetical protein